MTPQCYFLKQSRTQTRQTRSQEHTREKEKCILENVTGVHFSLT